MPAGGADPTGLSQACRAPHGAVRAGQPRTGARARTRWCRELLRPRTAGGGDRDVSPPLHVAGEHEHPVPPLELPDEAQPRGRADDRVRCSCSSSTPGWCDPASASTDANTADVVAVCRRLDGLPLAIELAAARIQAAQSRLRWWPGWTRRWTSVTTGVDRPTRQQTLRDTIAWSYDLLTPEQQSFLPPAGRVRRRRGPRRHRRRNHATAANAGDPLDLVADLVDASLVTVTEGPDGEPRSACWRRSARTPGTSSSRRRDPQRTPVRPRGALSWASPSGCRSLRESRAPRWPAAWPRAELDNFREALDLGLPRTARDRPGPPDGAARWVCACAPRWAGSGARAGISPRGAGGTNKR